MLVAQIVCLLLGPLAWLGLITLSFFARFRMGRLLRSRDELPAEPPTLSIVMPAHNEGSSVAENFRRLVEQDYPNAEIIGIDDRSTDETPAALAKVAAESAGRARVVTVDSLPPGWLGKCHALHVGTRELRSDWILFVDSDVTLAPDAARKAVALAVARGYDALSVFIQLRAPGFWESTLLPLLAIAWSGAYTISLTNDDSKPNLAFANGQFFLIKRELYERVGNHESVKDQIVEDCALMQRLKRAGGKVRLMLGQPLGTVRMHTNLKQIFNGWARIFAGTSGRRPGRILGVMLFVLLTVGALIVAGGFALATGDFNWCALAVSHAILMAGFTGWCYRSAGQPVANVLALPLSLTMMLAVLANALRVCVTGRVDWRGNAVRVRSNSGGRPA